MNKKTLVAGFALGFLLFVFPNSVLAGRGCCSWHGGQSFCDTSTGRWVCNDGTYSPTCTCTYIAPKAVAPITPKPTITPTIKPTIKPTETPTVFPTLTSTPSSTPLVQTTPTQTPQVQGASTQSSSVVGGLVRMGVFLTAGYYGLKWLARRTAPKEPGNTT